MAEDRDLLHRASLPPGATLVASEEEAVAALRAGATLIAPPDDDADGERPAGATLAVDDADAAPAAPLGEATPVTPPDGHVSGPTLAPGPAHSGPAPMAPPGRPTARVQLVPGARLGRWVLTRRLGEGATAEVWSAVHEQLGASVAIKVFRRHDLPFHNVLGEARAAAGIPSPYAIWVYDVDTIGGHHAIVMELCADGDQQAKSLRDVDVGPEQAATLVAQAAWGLQAAHEVDVFHKDVKPANILINPTDGRAQISDFGLANPALWRGAEKGGHTAQSTVCLDTLGAIAPRSHDSLAAIRGSLRLGTPEFMAPEQAMGLRRDLSPDDPKVRPFLVAMDVYGLGATLFHMLAGRPPFPLPDGPGDLDAKQIMDQVIAADTPSIRDAAPGVPRRLARIVGRAMARDPGDRYATAADLATDLEAWVSSHPTSLDSTIERLGVHLYRERAAATVLAILAVVVLASSWMVIDNGMRIAAQQSEIDEQRLELRTLAAQEAELRGDNQALNEALAATTADRDKLDGIAAKRAAALAAEKRKLAEAASSLDQTEARLSSTAERLAATQKELAATRATLVAAEAQGKALQNARDALQVELDRARAVAGRLTEDLSATEAKLRTEVAHAGELEATVRAKERELDRANATLAQRSADLAAREAQLADAQRQVSALREALSASRSAVAQLERDKAALQARLDAASTGQPVRVPDRPLDRIVGTLEDP